MNKQPTLESILVLGSSGKIGAALSSKLKESGYNVIGLDLNQSSDSVVDTFLKADVEVPNSLSALSEQNFEALVIAVPTKVAGAVVSNVIIPYCKECLVVDFLSETYRFSQLMESEASAVEHISVHQLFAPSVGWEGQNVLVTPRAIPGDRARAFISTLEEWGAAINYCDPLEHDQLMGLIQVGVHAAVISYAQYLVNQKVDFKLLDKISTPASRIMWSMIARMIGNDPSVYWEIQTQNAAAQDVRDEMVHSIGSLNELVQSGDKKSFDRLFERLRNVFGDDMQKYDQLANELSDHPIQKK